MTSLLPDVYSLFGSSKSQPAEVPRIGAEAPSIDGVNFQRQGKGSLVAFVRHCGCPFAEQEVRQLGKLSQQDPTLAVVIVAHSEEAVVQAWFQRVGASHFAKEEQVTVRADPDYRLYNAFGIGQLGWDKLFTRRTLSAVRSLAHEGIRNTPTGQGSNRWLNSGGFAIDQQGIVRWSKVAEQASDVCDYEEAVKALG